MFPSPEMILEGFAQLDPTESLAFTKEQRMAALVRATQVAHTKNPKGPEEALDILYKCYKDELKKLSN